MILAILDMQDGSWNISCDGDSTSVAVGFSSEEERIQFSNLSFGWSVFCNSTEVKSVSYPEAGIRYTSADQNYMSYDSVPVFPDDSCLLSIWAENGGVRYGDTYEWVVERPTSIFSSWVWNEEENKWEAPIPMPEDGNTYVWDESSGSWLIYGIDQ